MPPSKAPVYSYSIPLEPLGGLEAEVYNVTLVVNREDGEPLSKAEVERLRALESTLLAAVGSVRR